jgi:hypothetical protein
MNPEYQAVQRAIEVLNRIHTKDPTVLQQLIEHRVPCNAKLLYDETVQVGPGPGYEGYEVGLLGIVNGLFGVDESGAGLIGACYDDDHNLIGFAGRYSQETS